MSQRVDSEVFPEKSCVNTQIFLRSMRVTCFQETQVSLAPEKLKKRQKEKQMPPINMRWAIKKNYTEMVEAGVLFRYGRKILIDPDTFWVWLKEKGRKDARI